MHTVDSLSQSIHLGSVTAPDKMWLLYAVCISLYNVYNNFVWAHASRIKCESPSYMRVAFYASCLSILRVAFQFANRLLHFAKCTLFCDFALEFLRAAFNFCESWMTPASRLLLLQIAYNFMRVALNASRVLYKQVVIYNASCIPHYARPVKCDLHTKSIRPSQTAAFPTFAA